MMGMFNLIYVVWRPSTLHEHDEFEVTDRREDMDLGIGKISASLGIMCVEHWDNNL